MSPDTLPAPCPIRRDTRALQPPPPPLIPSHPTGLRGRCHHVVMIPELWRLVRGGGDDGGVERRKRGDERRGFKPQLDPRELSLIYLHLFFCILLTTHCRSWANNRQLSTNSVFSRKKKSGSEEQKQFNHITNRTNLSSASPCVVTRHPFYDMRIPLRFQPRGCYYLIQSPSCTRLQI